MPMEESDYARIRDLVQPGDIIAFGGNGFLSRLIEVSGGTAVSHVGIVVEEASNGRDPKMVESTVDFDHDPPIFVVMARSLEERYLDYDGKVWWLPLNQQVRDALQLPELRRFLKEADGQPFDIPGGLWVVIRDLFQRVRGHEYEREFRAYFCSELVARALESASAVGDVDESLVSPSDLCRWKIYDAVYHYLLKRAEPTAKEIKGFNSRKPGST